MSIYPVQVIYKPVDKSTTNCEHMLVRFPSEFLALEFVEKQNALPAVEIAKYLGKIPN